MTETELAETAWVALTLTEHTEAGLPFSVAVARTASEHRLTVSQVLAMARTAARLSHQALEAR